MDHVALNPSLSFERRDDSKVMAPDHSSPVAGETVSLEKPVYFLPLTGELDIHYSDHTLVGIHSDALFRHVGQCLPRNRQSV